VAFRFNPCSPCCAASNCRWMCGRYVVFSLPPVGTSALGAIDVASDGTISAARVVSGGSGYTTAHPTAIVQVMPGHTPAGSGATLQATVGEVTYLTIQDGGKYTSPPSGTIAAPGSGGTTATFTTTIDPDTGAVNHVTITDPGSLYQVSHPTVTVDPPPAGGRQAVIVAYARPGVVTSLKILTPGSGYLDNSTPRSLDFTMSCPAWSVTISLKSNGGVLGGVTPRGIEPAGTLPFCDYAGKGTIDVPATGTCDGVDGIPFVVDIYYNGNVFVVTINWDANRDPASTFACQGATLKCLTMTPTSFIADPANDGPNGSNSLVSLTNCGSRPYAWTGGYNIPAFSGPDQFGAWYLLTGGDCSQTSIPLSLTLSEP
jgi:hypothetical protein